MAALTSPFFSEAHAPRRLSAAPTIPPGGWTFEAAERLAEHEGLLVLTPAHWTVIVACREEFARTGRAPDAQALAAHSRVAERDMVRLFPGNTAALVARIAGVGR